MARAIYVMAAITLLVLSACTQHLICPAYQSAFIYDQEALRQKFSYFKEDSTPKLFAASKTRYLIATPVSYRKKERGLQTVPMKEVKTVLPDSLLEQNDLAAEDLKATDSLATGTAPTASDSLASTDSTYVITIDKEVKVVKYDPITRKYNIDQVGLNLDQDYYMWYLRDILVLPDVKLSKLQEGDEKKATKKENPVAGTKKSGGFFKNLFKKKEKPDSLAATSPPGGTDEKPAKKKGGLFKGKKHENKDQNTQQQTPQPQKKEEAPREGF